MSRVGEVAQCLLCRREARIRAFEDAPDDWATLIYRQPGGLKLVHHLCGRCDEAWNQLPNVDIMRALVQHAPRPAPLFASVTDCLATTLRALARPFRSQPSANTDSGRTRPVG